MKKQTRCILCKQKLEVEDASPWSLCYDPQWKVNIWGGDTHEYKGYFCRFCAKAMLAGKKTK